MCGNFFSSGIGSYILPALGFALGGPVGAGIAGAAQGGIVEEGGWGGALKGGLQGYGLGSGISNMTGYGGNYFGLGGAASGASGWGSMVGDAGPSEAFFDGNWGMQTPGTGGIAGGAGAGGTSGGMSDWVKNIWKKQTPGSLLQTGMSVGSGLLQMSNAADLKSQAMSMRPGGNLPNEQLTALLSNPGGMAMSDPAYALRQRAASRATATMGANSGAAAVAAANASTDWYNQRLAQLGGLAGQGADVGLKGTIASNQMMGSALANIGFGVNQFTGGSNGINPQLLQLLQRMSGGG